MYLTSPLGALWRGLAAGTAASAVQGAFFAASGKLQPKPPEQAFEPPEPQQKSEMATETVARRLVEDLAQRGPLHPEAKKQGAQAVHFAFGAGWGGLYGLARGTWPGLRSPLAALGFGAVVWAVSDNAILPAFQLSGPPQAYPAKNHAYALAAHLVYGAALWLSYELLRPSRWAAAAGALWALNARRKARRWVPRRAAPISRTVIDNLGALYAKRPTFRAVAEGIR